MRLRALPPALIVSAALAGCGGGHEALEKQLGDMRSELVKLRADQAALAERLDNAELGRGAWAPKAPGAPAASGAPVAPAAAPKADGDRPSLEVVRLSPNEGDGDADGDGPRPVIRSIGPSVVKGAAPPGKKPDKAAAPKKGPLNKP